MSAIWLKLISILCLSCSALSRPVSSGVVWRDLGGSITIQCRPPGTDQEYLSLKKGLSEELEVFYRDGASKKNNVADEFVDRLQIHGVFPNMDILIKNLTSDDTGPYWCLYKKFDPTTHQRVNSVGNGSVLLVVRDKLQQCDDQSGDQLILVSLVICSAVLFGIIIVFLIWIVRKTKTYTTKKPRRVPNNEVYEDMRGTIRR
ncbi:uncharacterized protein LOC141781252 isoform X2 [Sebastes fasciatus]|uniref:uncharacterized protein LOC141781252 isoform X2 n=1 Tax=Sebastes fasciatus TaxID=394691 RepID=UPI003D9E2B29